ncbi:unnamed protein product [Paramecium pentaurelia]|uniref:Uncharacterized protein n=1 Tax=Paramecium pentaurelia TaxID=43138 RepID=A0A8S1VQ73_9CILI|nr:unnamed protein product [Paramecium pentaurelia]
MNLQFKLVQHYFKRVQNYQNTIKYYFWHKYQTEINLQDLETILSNSIEPIAILNVQRLIEFNILQEEYSIQSLFYILDKLQKTLTEYQLVIQIKKWKTIDIYFITQGQIVSCF